MSTETEKRLAAALAARAEQVGPHDLTEPTRSGDRSSPPPRPTGLRRPVVALAAAAACVAALGAGVVVAGLGGDAPAPAPAPVGPEVVLPPDVGRAWPASPQGGAALDLDGDGEADRVRFGAEPAADLEGRTRLDVRLSGGGTAYGVVDLGTTLYGYDLDPVDADADGDEELLLARAGDDGTTTYPFVVELRGDVLVEAPIVRADGAVLQRGPRREPGGGTADYALDRASDFWVSGGALSSGLSRRAFPAAGESWWVPDPYVADTWTWRLGEDDVLRAEPAGTRCLSATDDARPACAPGDEALPELAPVETATAGAGDSFRVEAGPPATVTVVQRGGRTVAEVTPDGRGTARVPLRAGAQVFRAPAPALLPDEVALVLDQDADGAPDGLLGVATAEGGVSWQASDGPPAGVGDGTSWLTAAGEVFSLTGPEEDATLLRWARGPEGLFVVPVGPVCGPAADPARIERC